jgi:hypothetical protein
MYSISFGALVLWIYIRFDSQPSKQIVDSVLLFLLLDRFCSTSDGVVFLLLWPLLFEFQARR